MLRENFLYNFFKYKKNTNLEIVKFDSTKKIDIEDQITNKIIEIDQKILESSQALLQAQIVKFKSTFSNSNNLLEKIGKNVYQKKIDDSIKWYQKDLKELYLKRKILNINLEKIKGIFWLNRIIRVLKTILIIFLIIFSLFIFLSGFMIIIYLLPLILLIFISYPLFIKNIR